MRLSSAPVASTTMLPTWSSVGGIALRPASTRPAAAISSSSASGGQQLEADLATASLVRSPSGATVVRTRSSEIALPPSSERTATGWLE